MLRINRRLRVEILPSRRQLNVGVWNLAALLDLIKKLLNTIRCTIELSLCRLRPLFSQLLFIQQKIFRVVCTLQVCLECFNSRVGRVEFLGIARPLPFQLLLLELKGALRSVINVRTSDPEPSAANAFRRRQGFHPVGTLRRPFRRRDMIGEHQPMAVWSSIFVEAGKIGPHRAAKDRTLLAEPTRQRPGEGGGKDGDMPDPKRCTREAGASSSGRLGSAEPSATVSTKSGRVRF